VAERPGQVDGLRRKVERKDTIIMQMAQRIPELEAPPGPEIACKGCGAPTGASFGLTVALAAALVVAPFFGLR